VNRRLAREYIPTLIANDKDFLSTRISYKLDLRGPSITVQTACSTSLVAIHLARQSLLSEETDMASPGHLGASSHRAGYFFRRRWSDFSGRAREKPSTRKARNRFSAAAAGSSC